MLLGLGTAIPAEVPLMAAGLDSIAATELSQKLGEQFEVELPSTLLFDHPTASSMTQLLLDKFQCIHTNIRKGNDTFEFGLLER